MLGTRFPDYAGMAAMLPHHRYEAYLLARERRGPVPKGSIGFMPPRSSPLKLEDVMAHSDKKWAMREEAERLKQAPASGHRFEDVTD